MLRCQVLLCRRHSLHSRSQGRETAAWRPGGDARVAQAAAHRRDYERRVVSSTKGESWVIHGAQYTRTHAHLSGASFTCAASAASSARDATAMNASLASALWGRASLSGSTAVESVSSYATCGSGSWVTACDVQEEDIA